VNEAAPGSQLSSFNPDGPRRSDSNGADIRSGRRISAEAQPFLEEAVTIASAQLITPYADWK